MMAGNNNGARPERHVDVITTHVNADYDALASMLGAAKLYPEAMLVLPGSQERNLRNFFVESTCYFFNFVKVKDVPFKQVKRLILVDTRQIDRIGPLARLAEDPKVEIHAYDHHPDSETDVVANMQMVEKVGATVTLLSGLLQERGVILNSDEATLLALGIYEDTGSFTFPSTTEADYKAAAWLLSQGANLSLISSLITRELTAEEVGVLNDMIHAATPLKVGPVEVMLTEVSRGMYVPEFAVLVHRFMEMDNLDALFALGRFEGRVYLVARSRLPEVDAGVIASAFGGGGHPAAASATLRDLTLVEARERLMGVLNTRINPTRRARDIMTGPVVSVPPDAGLDEAHTIMSRYGLSVLPVIKENKALGIIDLDTVERGMRHGLGEISVSEYMERGVETIAGEAPLAQVEQALVGERQLMVPVREEGVIKGVITRDDYFSAVLDSPVVMQDQSDLSSGSNRVRDKKIISLMRERLPKHVLEVLSDIGRAAHEQDCDAFLVGGSVRDLFLRHENLDLDLVLEGDAMDFARSYAQGKEGLRARTHKKFRTAKLIYDDGLKIDLATARLEYYRAPAALPVVELSSLKMDLYRRDFTINTLAVCLAPDDFGRLIDFFDGLRDLKGRVVRVLHNLSFVEDPTRIFRAVRFEQRFGFRIGKFSEGLIKNALKIDAIRQLSGDRIFGEFRHMMNEDHAGDCLRRLNSLNLLEVLHPKLKLGLKRQKLVTSAEESLAWYRLSFLDQPIRRWLVFLLAISDGFKEPILREIMERFSLAPRLRQEIIEMRRMANYALNRLQRNPLAPSEVYRLLHRLRPAYLLYIMTKARKEHAKRAVSLYLTTYTHVKISLSGQDLTDMGFVPGPGFKEVLERVLSARLDGEVENRQEEIDLVKREFAVPLGENA